ncbi:MAG: M1 family metallopeptidase [Ignavibacteriaceae bacterium]
MNKILFKILAFILSFLFFQPVYSQIIFQNSLSPRNASYDMDVTLNPAAKTIDGFEILHWRNISNDIVTELQFHLYLNAFKNTKSTFVKESGGQLRGISINENSVSSWGWIDVQSMKIENGEDLTNKIKYIHPDDDNIYDETVISVPLSRRVKPGETININIKFKSKLPQIFARSGYAGNYFLVGQWFPKIGVYEFPGIRYAVKGEWNCHQYHANSEFYADFGVYNVNITLPQKYTVGAVGIPVSEKENGDGTKTIKYHAEDVIDFAWTASPRFRIVWKKWENVKIKIMLQPEHFYQADRYIHSILAALKYFKNHVGIYPYPNLTIVDPPFNGLGSGGMEYPTFFTGLTLWGIPDGIKLCEITTIHEFGHNYFMGMLASNEFEEAWMDEGINSYMESRIMDNTYGEKTSQINIAGLHTGDLESMREGYVGMPNPKIAGNARFAWQYQDGGYGAITYYKTATWMTTLDRLAGRKVMDEILKTYFERWKFKHPCSKNFIDIVNEVVKRRLGNKFGENMNWFFDEVLYGTNICDYKLAGIYVSKKRNPLGVYDSSRIKMYYKNEPSDKKHVIYHSKVSVFRLGDVVMPVEILVHFNNGKDTLVNWDGKERTFNLKFDMPQKVVWAKVDPEQKLYMDLNLNNNSYTTERERTPFKKYMTKFIFWVENLITSMSMIF